MEHCKKHESEYSSHQAFVEAVECIPEILKHPDYVGIHKNGNIQFVKKYSDISLVGVKIIKSDNSLLFRTIYPISESKLNNSIKNGKLYKINIPRLSRGYFTSSALKALLLATPQGV